MAFFAQHLLRHKFRDRMEDFGLNYFCSNCDEGFTTEADWKAHKSKNHTLEDKTNCQICSIQISQCYLGDHMLIEHEYKEPCAVCGYGTKKSRHREISFNNISAHVKNASQFHINRCEYEDCQQVLLTWNDKKKHMEVIHRDIWKYRCDHCGQIFDHDKRLRSHILEHHPKLEEKNLNCELCGKLFGKKYALQLHVEMNHPSEEEKVFPCDVCGKTYNNKHSLICHRKSVHIVNPCQICGKMLSKGIAREHMLRHHTPYEQMPYKCDPCSKGFINAEDFKYHTYTHTGEKPFKCDMCELGFAHPNNLRIHKRVVHLGLKRTNSKSQNK